MVYLTINILYQKLVQKGLTIILFLRWVKVTSGQWIYAAMTITEI